MIHDALGLMVQPAPERHSELRGASRSLSFRLTHGRYDGNLDIEIDEEDLKLDLSLVSALRCHLVASGTTCGFRDTAATGGEDHGPVRPIAASHFRLVGSQLAVTSILVP